MPRVTIPLDNIAEIEQLRDLPTIDDYAARYDEDSFRCLLRWEVVHIAHWARLELVQSVVFNFWVNGIGPEQAARILALPENRARRMIDDAVSKISKLNDVGMLTVIAEEFGSQAAQDWLDEKFEAIHTRRMKQKEAA